MTALSHGDVVPPSADDRSAAVGVADNFIDLRDGVLAHAKGETVESVQALPRPAVSSPGAAPTAGWRPRYTVALLGLDAFAFVAAGVIAMAARFGQLDEEVDGLPYLVLTFAGVVPWVATIAVCRGYEWRFFGLGSEEFRRVADAAVRFTALVAMVAFAANLDIARGLVAIALPAASALTLMQRYVARQLLHRVRRYGTAGHRVVVVGDEASARSLIGCLHDSPHAGLRVVGHCRPTGHLDASGQDSGLTDLRRLVGELEADTVAIAHCASMTTDALRRLAWALEGAGVDLLVAPAFTDVAGPRIHVRPVSGLPLLQIAAPEFSGARRILKRTIDLAGTGTLLVVLAPILMLIALVVAVTSRGPVLFRQTRVGRGGREFTLYKFRSMHANAEELLPDLLQHNDSDGVLFKMMDDPRVTPIGRWLRRLSLDELPQLVNVALGQMSLVGPRPPLPSEVARYEHDVHRRLLVTPGITGLWQVSGRSDLSWSQSVRLDLYYVENWSVALDFEILWKTLFAVVRGSGAR